MKMKRYYLVRWHPHQKWVIMRRQGHEAENIGPFASYEEAINERNRLNGLM